MQQRKTHQNSAWNRLEATAELWFESAPFSNEPIACIRPHLRLPLLATRITA